MTPDEIVARSIKQGCAVMIIDISGANPALVGGANLGKPVIPDKLVKQFAKAIYTNKKILSKGVMPMMASR